MLSIINYNSGELKMSVEGGAAIQLSQPQAHRLILAARMQSVDAFLIKLPQLIPDADLVQRLADMFSHAQGTERWNLKEKFARLQTITAGFQPENPEEIAETVRLDLV